MVNLRLSYLGVLAGVILFMGALTWWSVGPDSPSLASSVPSAHRAPALVSNSVPGNRTRHSEPRDPADDTTPKLSAEDPGEVTLERRCLQLAERDPRAAVVLASETPSLNTHPGLVENLVAQWATRDLQASKPRMNGCFSGSQANRDTD